MKKDDSQFVRHEPCPNCGSSDALARYSSGTGFCFSCHTYSHGDGNIIQTKKPRRVMNYDGDFAAIKSRNISEETCRRFNVRVDQGPVIRFPYYSSTRSITAYKERNRDKEFRWVGSNSEHQLFGQHLWGAGKCIVCVEGELDCLATAQARPSWPVVSVPNGAASAKRDLKHQLPFLMGFDEIVLLFDNDEAGQAATEECASLFPPDRVFIGNLGNYKDACEALADHNPEAIRQAIWNKRPYSPQNIVDGRDLFDLVSTPLHGKDADWPWPELNRVTGGLRLNELVTWTAGSGCGKSTAVGEVAMSLVDQGFSIAYIALEESLKRQALRLMTVKANKPLHLDNQIDEQVFKESFERSIGSGNIWLRDGFGSVDPDLILNDIRFVCKQHDTKWVILDHLSILLSGNTSDDERKLIDRTMTKLRSFTEETGIGMILISHLRRLQGDKAHEDGATISLSQLRGSHGICQLSDLVIGQQRNISSGENTSDLVVLKNRFNGQTGPAGQLTYNKDTGRLTATTECTPASYEDF